MCQIKAPIAGNSKAIAKIGKAYRILLSPLVGTPHRCIPAGDEELAYFNQQMLIHELIRGSLISNR
jgi:hypothetical protein